MSLTPCSAHDITQAMSQVHQILETHEKSRAHHRYAYGTAGFRALATQVPHVMVKCTLFALLRSAETRQVCGICITASHNPPQDNGVKLIDGNGQLLPTSIEPLLTDFVNAPCPYLFFTELLRTIGFQDISSLQSQKLILGYDTRPSSLTLRNIVVDTAHAVHAQIEDLGVVSTPQVHFMVARYNTSRDASDLRVYTAVCEQFLRRFATCLTSCETRPLYVDCANGVGAFLFDGLRSVFAETLHVDIRLRNTNEAPEDQLNHLCGADYVEKHNQFPIHMRPSDIHSSEHFRCCSFDGDADRLVYLTCSEDQSLILLNGDRIACLFALCIARLIQNTLQTGPPSQSALPIGPLTIGLVQTAYSNGGSSQYWKSTLCPMLRAMGLQPEYHCVSVGVKHLLHQAAALDIGICFESNGHGTVLVQLDRLRAGMAPFLQTPAYAQLESFLGFFSPWTGDAFFNLCAAETALRYLDMDLHAWHLLYEDLYCAQSAHRIPAHQLTLFVSEGPSGRLKHPRLLQERIDAHLNGLPRLCRGFIRASGTEPCLRLYAEAPDQDTAAHLLTSLHAFVQETLDLAAHGHCLHRLLPVMQTVMPFLVLISLFVVPLFSASQPCVQDSDCASPLVCIQNSEPDLRFPPMFHVVGGKCGSAHPPDQPAVTCFNSVKTLAYGATLFVDLEGTHNDLFRSTESTFDIVDLTSHQQVSKSFEFVCDQSGTFTLRFLLQHRPSGYPLKMCYMTIVCRDEHHLVPTQKHIKQYNEHRGPDLGPKTPLFPLEAELAQPREKRSDEPFHLAPLASVLKLDPHHQIECLPFKASGRVNRSISIPVENLVYKRLQPNLTVHIDHFHLSLEPVNALASVVTPQKLSSSGPLFTHTCTKVQLENFELELFSFHIEPHTQIAYETQLCAFQLDCYANDPPVITCKHPAPILIGTSSELLVAADLDAFNSPLDFVELGHATTSAESEDPDLHLGSNMGMDVLPLEHRSRHTWMTSFFQVHDSDGDLTKITLQVKMNLNK